MKKIFLLLLAFSYFKGVFGQNGMLISLQYKLCSQCPNGDNQSIDYSYDNDASSYITENIESDYDMRVADGTRFHQGIDYLPRNDCRGDAILNVEQGVCTVMYVGGGNSSLKNIVLQNQDGTRAFVYMHCFVNANIGPDGLRSGDFLIKRIDNSTELTIINMNSSPVVAYAKTPNRTVTYKRYVNSTTTSTVQTTNHVDPGAMIAPIGDSGEVPGVHLHISLIESPTLNDPAFRGGRDNNRSVDPWTVLEHPQTNFFQQIRTRKIGNFDASICEHTGPGTDSWGQIVPDYSGDTRNTIEIEVALDGAAPRPNDDSRYANKCMDQEEVVLGIKNLNFNSDFSVATGSDFESKFIINPIGDKIIYPFTMLLPNGTAYGSPTRNGMSPFAYRDYIGFHPHDYYFVSDFYMRISKNDNLLPAPVPHMPPPVSTHTLAQFPWDARYPDGDYQMRPSILEVNSSSWQPMANPVDFKIDNFKPFIVKVGLFVGNVTSSSTPAYYRAWSTDGAPPGSLRLSGLSGKQPSSTSNQPITVYVVASESMSKVRAFINGLTGWVDGTTLPFDSNDPDSWGHQKWEFQFGTYTLDPDICYNIVFEGEDLSGNKLLNLPQPLYCNTGSNLIFTPPHRTGSNSWSNNSIGQGSDWVHKFRLDDCGGIFNLSPSDPCITSEDVQYSLKFSEPQSHTGSIDMDISANTNGASFTWSDESGAVISNSEDISNLPPGVYCIEILKDCCSFNDCLEIGTCALNVTESHTNPSNNEHNGEITLLPEQGIEPYSYHWNTGETTDALFDLPAGTYTCTVTDHVACQAVVSITLINCSPIEVEPHYTNVVQPTSCDSDDGSFRVLSVSTPTGGTPPYSYHWEDQDGNTLSGGPVYSGLGPGQYCIVATDANGCTGTSCLTLQALSDIYVSETIYPACELDYNGSISVFASTSTGGYCDFYWDTDFQNNNDQFSTITGLASGTYCVTVTPADEPNCITTSCYEVPSVWPEPMNLSYNVIHPCPSQHNGSINLTITGGYPPLKFKWEDIINDTDNRTMLGDGTYTVTVTDYCGSSISKTFILKSLEQPMLVSHPGCEGEGSIECNTVHGGNSPVTLKWSTGSTNYGTAGTINYLHSGNYCVTATESEGCTSVNCITLNNIWYTISKEEPCPGSHNGLITIHVNNPNEGEVSASLEGVQVFFNAHAPQNFDIEVPSLEGDKNYNFVFSIDNCIYSEIVHLANSPLEKEFLEYNGANHTCIYQNTCNGEPIPGSIVVNDAAYNYSMASGGFFVGCEIPVSCDGVQQDVLHIDKITIRAAQYEQILLHVAPQYFSIDVVESLLQAFYNQHFCDCTWVRYCPANLEITSVIEGLPGRCGNATPIEGEYGCFSLHCGIFGINDESFCLGQYSEGYPVNIIPSVFENYNYETTVEDCNPVTINLYQLIVWANDLDEYYQDQDFQSSPLYYYINNYQSDPRAKCATITFCSSNLQVLYCDVELVNCEDYENIYLDPADCSHWGDLFGEDDSHCEYFLCADPNENNMLAVNHLVAGDVPSTSYIHGHLQKVCDDFPGHFFSSPDESDEKLYLGYSPNESLINFGITRFQNEIYPKGILRVGEVGIYLDYALTMKYDRKEIIPNISYFVDDWDNNRLAYVENVQNGKSILMGCQNNILDWNYDLHSDNFLSVNYFNQRDSFYFVGGEFQGNLMHGETVIASGNNKSGYLMKIGKDGSTLSTDIFRMQNPNQALIFESSDNGIHVLGRGGDQPLSINGVNQLVANNSIFDLLITNQGLASVYSSVPFDPTKTIVRSAYSSDGSYKTFLLRDNNITGSEANSNLTIYTESTNGNYWTETIDGNITNDDVSVVCSTDSSIIVGVSFQGTLSLQDVEIQNYGSTDIALLKFSTNGELLGYLNYGTPASENISQLLVNDSIVYFGGEYQSTLDERAIGRHNFKSPPNGMTVPYLSYVELSDFQLVNNFKPNLERSDAPINLSHLQIRPNPFNQNFEILLDLTEDSNVQISIFDPLGRVLKNISRNAPRGISSISVSDLSSLPSGTYYLKVIVGGNLCKNICIIKK